MNYPLFLARRLSLSSEGRKSSPAVRVAVIAVALSVAVMLASIAIVFGFKREIREKVAGFNSHITLYASPIAADDDNLVSMTPSLRTLLDSVPFITSYNVQASMPAILKTKDNFKGVYLRSLGSEDQKVFLEKNLVEGKVPDYSDENNKSKILISGTAARQLGLKTGDKIDTYFITGEVKVRRLEISGVFNSHFDKYDDVYIYGALPLVQQLGGIKENQGTSITIHTDDYSRIEENAFYLHNKLSQALADGLVYKLYKVETLEQQGASYFRWLDLLDMNVAVVLVLMTFVACITLVSGMLIIILDKKRFIGLVRSLGASTAGVRRVFVYLAMKIAATGLVCGNAVMLLLLYLQDRYHFIPLDAEAYYIDFVPVEIDWNAVLLLNAATLVVIYLVLILPSWFVARISPAETMRSEE